ncbi:MAG: ABC transporter permease [Clostridiales bacterium]|nr:ABC transporter permease [Clostridiales bacterium]
MNKTKSSSMITNLPYIVWSIIFIIAPLIMVAYYAFTDRDANFTLSNIKLLWSGHYPEIFGISILFAVIATAVCFIISYPLALVMVKSSNKVQRNVMLLVMVPMWMNFLIRTYSWRNILSDNGIINTFLESIGIGKLELTGTAGAVIFGMVYNFLPYMILPIYSVMSKLDVKYVEAAEDLGATKIQVLLRVIFPLSLPGVISGITMVFVPSVSTFYISQKLGEGKFMLIGDSIELQFQQANNYNLGASLSLVLMVLIIISMLIMNKFSDDEGAVII